MMTNVLELLEQSAKRIPDRPAFGDPEGDLTFAGLLNQAQRLGTALLPEVQPRTPAAFYMEKSNLCMSGMLGAVYAGGFYSVLDTRQPEARALKVLEVLQPSALLTDRANAEKAQALLEAYVAAGHTAMPFHILEDLLEQALTIDEAGLTAVRAQATDLDPLYVNFTSGSTGIPKGVTVGHRSVLGFISSFTKIFDIRETDILGNQAPFDFDVSVKDIYSGLMTGAKVQIIPREYFSAPAQLMDYLCDKRVTVLVWAVSAMCFVSIMNGLQYRNPETLRMVMFSGEMMPVKHLNKWKQYQPDVTYVNLYGPTEITCNCTYHVLDREYGDTEAIPAGKAFPNERVFLLDEEDNDVTNTGSQGEICVAGSCLALGYYKDPERTAAAFCQNPLNKRYNEQMYRTGDLGFFNENGDLIYVGRKDFQIKHLGHRIELGEIENVTAAQEGVDRACCVYDHEKKKILLYYTGSVEKKPLLAALRAVLPPFMIPNQANQLAEMPLNKNGKIDRAALREAVASKA